MKITRFIHLTESYGAEIGRWPEAERAAARALAAESPEARRALAQARELDILLSVAEPAVGDTREERVFAAIMERVERPVPRGPVPRGPAPWTLPRGVWPAAGFLAAMAVLGVLAGGLFQAHSGGAGDLASLVSPPSYTIAWNQ